MRNFDKESSITRCFTSKQCPLIKIDADRNLTEYQSKKEKLDALMTRKDGDKFIIAWVGQWRTDVFNVNEEDIQDAILEYL